MKKKQVIAAAAALCVVLVLAMLYTIHYFPFGRVGMSYHLRDGYNLEKTLTKLQ